MEFGLCFSGSCIIICRLIIGVHINASVDVFSYKADEIHIDGFQAVYRSNIRSIDNQFTHTVLSQCETEGYSLTFPNPVVCHQ